MSIRNFLKQQTCQQHQALDDILEGQDAFRSSTAYAHYLRRTLAFRTKWEAYLASWSDVEGMPWRPTRLKELLLSDLLHIGEPMSRVLTDEKPIATMSNDIADFVGASYVLEGSNLGARLLLVRARCLGLVERSAAQHLERQANALSNWSLWLEMIDRLELDHHARLKAAATARAVFASAIAAHMEYDGTYR